MGAKQDLKPIENFEGVYESRWEEFKILKREGRKVLCMHLGGILIECLLKNLLVKKHGIEKKKSLNWYDDHAVNELIATNNPNGQLYNAKKTLKNPGHKFSEAFKQLKELRNNFEKVEEQNFDRVAFPYTKDPDCDFIGLRYIQEEEITDEEFDTWYDSFKGCVQVINKYMGKIKEDQ